MKRIITLILAAFILVPAAPFSAQARGVNKTQISALVREYSHRDGFDVVSIGSLGMRLMKLAAKSSAETKEDREALDFLNKLNRVVIVSYEDADADVKKKFNTGLDRILRNQETLLEAKSDGEAVHIFGDLSDDGQTLRDVVLRVPGSDALICLFGSLPASKIADAIDLKDM